MAAGAAAIEVRDLVKQFGDRAALRGVSFDAAAGELLAVIGPNGAGKTTLLSILAGIRSPDRGSVSVARQGRLGAAVRRRSTAGSRWLRTCACSPASRRSTTSRRRSSGCSPRPRSRERRDDQVGTLSGGNQQRVNIAIGLLSRPAVLLLDEPATGLDPRQRERLWEFVLGLAGGGTTVIYSTHHLLEAERYGDRLLVLADGERIFDGTASELHAAAPGSGAHDFEAAFVRFLAERGH